MKKILVIEDKKDEKAKAREAVEARDYYCYVAEDLHDAYLALGEDEEASGMFGANVPNSKKIEWDGIITDLHFPQLNCSEGLAGREEAYGLEIMVFCSQRGIPCVVCTDMDHHHCSWIYRVAKRLGAGLVADKGHRFDSRVAWEEAVRLLSRKLQ